MNDSERGDSLIEVIVAVAILAIALAAITAATITAAHRFGADPIQSALQAQVARELRLAIDLEKYQGATIAPKSVATSIPLPGSSPIPAHLSLNVTTLPSGGVAIAITAQSDLDAAKSATLNATIAEPAPLPSCSVTGGTSVAAPVGAQ